MTCLRDFSANDGRRKEPVKSTDNLHPARGVTQAGRRIAVAGILSIGLLASALAPAVAQETTPAAVAPSYTEQVLAKAGDNAIDPVLGRYYRIPALADLGNGVVLASYDGRPDGGDSPSPNSIIQRRSTDGGKTWGAPTYIARGQMGSADTLRYGFSDPSYVVDAETGTVFNFHVYSKDVSFQGSSWGNDDADRQVISAEVSVSTDGGLSWSTDPQKGAALPVVSPYAAGTEYSLFQGPLITDLVKPVGSTVGAVAGVGGIKGVFAASGEGIQLKFGPHKGRLIQQFTGVVRQADGSTPYQAYSVYSDDHGKTWQRGAFVGTGMDENKVVELSNGNVMINSRASSGGNGGRKIAISTDGGATYGPVTVDTNLVDPVNNASIIKMFPNAAQNSDQAKILLFSNANSSSSRSNGTIRYSCDNGTTWSAGKQFKAGTMSYSTLTALSDGTFGVFYEGDGNTMTFGKFNAEWLGVFCGANVSAKTVSGAAGTAVSTSVTVTNNGITPLAEGTLSIRPQAGWTFSSASIPALAVGASAEVALDLSIPNFAIAKAYTLSAEARYGSGTAVGALTVNVTAGSSEKIVGAAISGVATDTARNLATNPYTAGATVPYKFRVDSLSNIASNVTPQSGNFAPFLPADGSGNCRFNNLAAGAGYDCPAPKHTVTAPELANGFFIPLTTWQVTGTGATTQNYTITGEEVNLVDRKPSLSFTRTAGEVVDVDGSGFASVGDTITFTSKVTNTGNVTVTGISGNGAPFDGAPFDLAAGAVNTSSTVYALTASDIAAKKVNASTVTANGANGVKGVGATAITPAVGLCTAANCDTSTETVGATIVGNRTDSNRDLAGNPYVAGQSVPYNFKVTSTSSIVSTVAPTAGNFAGFNITETPNCRYRNLGIGAFYNCGTPTHVVSAAELSNGYFSPNTAWEVTGTGATTAKITIVGEEVDLLVRKPSLAVSVVGAAPGAVAKVGDVIPFTLTVVNDGNVTLTGLTTAATSRARAASLLPVDTLAPGANTQAVVERQISAEDIAAGQVAAPVITVAAENGLKSVAQPAAGEAVELIVDPAVPEPTESASAAPSEPAPSESAPSESASAEPSESESAAPSESATAAPSASSEAPSASASPSNSATAEPSNSASAEPSESTPVVPSESASATPSDSASAAPSDSVSAEPTDSPEASQSVSASGSASATQSSTTSQSASQTATGSSAAAPSGAGNDDAISPTGSASEGSQQSSGASSSAVDEDLAHTGFTFWPVAMAALMLIAAGALIASRVARKGARS